MCGYISGSSDTLVFLSVFVPIVCWFYCYGSIVQFEVRYCDASSIRILLRIALAIQGLLCFHIYFKINFSISVQKSNGILLGIALNM
jgi:hypothetical protein